MVLSLSSIDDAVTREWMQHFYGRLVAGASRADALAQASAAIRASHPDPYY